MNSPDFSYPAHYTQPEGAQFYFSGHIKTWLNQMPDMLGRPNVTLEIGALFGGASVFMLETYCKAAGSHHYICDINTNDAIENNIKPYADKCTYCLGKSEDILRTLTYEGKTKEFVDLAYIDGNHMAKFVLEDAMNCFYLVKNGGYIVFDDYGWGRDGPEHTRPATGIEAFQHAYQKHLEVIDVGWQVIMKKTGYELNPDEKNSNYYTGWKHTTKTAV